MAGFSVKSSSQLNVKIPYAAKVTRPEAGQSVVDVIVTQRRQRSTVWVVLLKLNVF